jgi:Flp pilus assembly protein TadD
MPYRQQPGVAGYVPYGRSDHSISIPRPGVDEVLGTASACALCHEDRSVEDLAAQTREWYGELAARPALVRAVASARAMPEGEPLPRPLVEDLVEPGEPNPLLRMAALNEVVEGYLHPDLGTEEVGVDAADAVLVERLRALAAPGAEGPDVVAGALALLHLGWGDAMEVRAFLDGRRVTLREEDGVAIRWARALQLIGDRWRSSGRMEWALRAFTRAQEVRPADPAILLDLASAYTGLRRFEESLPYYVQAIRLDPTQSVAFVNLGLTLENLGREPEAEGAYLRAVQMNPAEAVAHMNLGNISLRQSAYAEAAASYEEALRHDPSMARAGFYLAVSLVGLEDLEGARRALVAARDFAPDDPEIAQLLAQIEELRR